MRIFVKLFGLLLLAGIPFAYNPTAESPKSETSCAVVELALRDYQHLKVGGTRAQVADYFLQDGGAQFATKGRYVHPKCKFIHVDVEFEPVKPNEVAGLPNDKVIKVSQLYLDYSAKD